MSSGSFQEMFMPLYFVGILVGIKLGTKPSVKPALTFPETDINMTSEYPFWYQPCSMIYVSPDNTTIADLDSWMQSIVSEVSGSPPYRNFATEADAENEYRAKTDAGKICGISFSVNGNEYSYSIRIAYDDIPSTENGSQIDKGGGNQG